MFFAFWLPRCSTSKCNRAGSRVHPWLKLPLCIHHAERLTTLEKEGWPKDEEGLDDACRWCCGLAIDEREEFGWGEVQTIFCDRCESGWCEDCLQRHLGAEYVQNVVNADVRRPQSNQKASPPSKRFAPKGYE